MQETQQKPKKSIFKRIGFWLIMIFFVFPIIFAAISEDNENSNELEKQKEEQLANDSIKELQEEARRDSLYNIATPEEKKIYDAQEKRRLEYEAKKKQRALENEERSHHKVFNSKWDNSVIQVEHYLKNNLNDPDSYESVKWYAVSYNKKNNYYVVRHKYRANNAFGAKVLADQIFHLTPQGEIIYVKNTGE